MDEAVAEIRQRRGARSPRRCSLKANTALLSYFRGRYDERLEELLEISRADPDAPMAHWGIGLVYEQKGMGSRKRLAVAREGRRSSRRASNLQASLAHARRSSGARTGAGGPDDARRSGPGRATSPPTTSPLVHAGLGEKDRAFEWLERAYQERSTVLAYLRLDPRLAPLRSDPRFSALLRRVGVAPREVGATSGAKRSG